MNDVNTRPANATRQVGRPSANVDHDDESVTMPTFRQRGSDPITRKKVVLIVAIASCIDVVIEAMVNSRKRTLRPVVRVNGSESRSSLSKSKTTVSCAKKLSDHLESSVDVRACKWTCMWRYLVINTEVAAIENTNLASMSRQKGAAMMDNMPRGLQKHLRQPKRAAWEAVGHFGDSMVVAPGLKCWLRQGREPEEDDKKHTQASRP